MSTPPSVTAASPSVPDPAELERMVREALSSAWNIRRLAALFPLLDRDQLKTVADIARAARRELSGMDRWGRQHQQMRAGLVAIAAGAFTSPAEAAKWLGARDLQSWDGRELGSLVEIAARRDSAWQADVAGRLAERRPGSWGVGDGELVEFLVRASGAPVPDTDGFVTAWVRSRRRLPGRPGRSGRRTVPEQLTSVLPQGETLVAVLRADSFLPVLLHRLFEVDELGSDLYDVWESDDPRWTWTGSLALLAEEGVLDRERLLDLCVSRLLRGGRLVDVRFAHRLLEKLAPTVAEDAARASDLVRLIPDTPSVVAGHAQAALARLDAEGLLTPDRLTDASEALFFRTEKKLLKAQLQLLERVAKRQDADEVVLRCLAGALAVEDGVLRERAWRTAARLLRRGVEPPAELRDAVAALTDRELRAQAAALLGPDGPDGQEEPDDPFTDAAELPPPPAAPPFPAPLESAAEVVQELAVLLAGRDDPTTFERILDGLVRQARRDRPGLVAALAPLTQGSAFDRWSGWGDTTGADLAVIVDALGGDAGARRRLHVHLGRDRNLSAYGAAIAGRLDEAAQRLAGPADGIWPCLLATPSAGDGTLTPADLLARLREHRAAGVEPGPADLGQALLRLSLPADAAAAERWAAEAEAVGGAAAREVARWLRAGGPSRPAARITDRARRSEQGSWTRQVAARRVQVVAGATEVPVPLADCFAPLLGPTAADTGHDHYSWGRNGAPLWAWVTPHDAELLATHLQWRLASLADSEDRRHGAILPDLAACGGPVDLALHLAFVHGLAARHAEDRTAAVDGFLTLAARGRLDAELFGALVAESAHRGAVKGSRLAAGLTEAADAGAFRQVWPVLATALPYLIGGAPVGGTRHSGLAELLALATRCVERGGAGGLAVPEAVRDTATKGGGSRLTREARRLCAAVA